MTDGERIVDSLWRSYNNCKRQQTDRFTRRNVIRLPADFGWFKFQFLLFSLYFETEMSSSDSDGEMLHTISDSSETENDKKHDRVYKERVDY